MSGGQRQAVAVARAVAFSSKLVILDEPTAASGLRESARVLDLMRRLKDDGVAVILISHSMDHVMAVADRAVVLRRGRKVGETAPTEENHAQTRGLDRRRRRRPGRCDRAPIDLTNGRPTNADGRSALMRSNADVRLSVGARSALLAVSCGCSGDASESGTTEAASATTAAATPPPTSAGRVRRGR